MQSDPKLIMSQEDYIKLSTLLARSESETAELLDEELNRAKIVDPEQVPTDVVTMNSTVKFIDLEQEKEMVVTLVYPHDAKIDEYKISILTPIGAALIGLRVGQTITWPLPNGKQKQLKVISVEHVTKQ